MLFGRGAQVDVGGLVASTLGIKDTDFLSGRYVFTNGGGAGSVVNAGTITALSGYAALIGPQVTNTGLITARMGTVAMAAGDKVSLDMVGDGLISVRIDQAALNAAAINKGTISADGCNVLMTARSANALLDTVVNNEGVIRANTLTERGGSIYLDGGSTGVTGVSGTLEAMGLASGQKGGVVSVHGDKVGLFGNTSINVSGDSGGGTVLIGGDFQGPNSAVRNASRTYVGTDVTIKADAISKGDGGKVVVWADRDTRYFGSISARGGSQSGDGGNLEVSGKQSLLFEGFADTRAPKGKTGSLLLDPDDITITDQASGAAAQDAGFAGTRQRASSCQMISAAKTKNP